jgi:hypothetical protein
MGCQTPVIGLFCCTMFERPGTDWKENEKASSNFLGLLITIACAGV